MPRKRKPKQEPLPVLYEPNSPASVGRWKVVHKGRNVVVLRSFRTQFEAHQDAGLPGGSKDPRYIPEDARV